MGAMTPRCDAVCEVCGGAGSGIVAEEAEVSSNVRAFRQEVFAVWRCSQCESIHAREDVDLAHYYARYPFHALPTDWRMRMMYRNQLRRLRDAGIGRDDSILDYGSGGGDFVRYLQERGHRRVFGYDEYSPEFSDRAVFDRKYRCVFSQDVLEHATNPAALLDRFDDLVEPGGLIAVGTPNATAIDLKRPAQYAHTLHAPYHRHIFSAKALLAAGAKRSWRLRRYYETQYANTYFPFLNSRFYSYYMSVFDGSLDCLLDPPRLVPLLGRLPVTLFWGIFGVFFARKTDVMAIFNRPVVAS